MFRVIALAAAAYLSAVLPAPPQPQARFARNVLVVTMDGLRWQEVFGGLQADLLTKEGGGVGDITSSRSRFDARTAEARREKLMPFLWTVIARKGQVFGDATRNSPSRVTNTMRFSYPGYNELLAGFADPRIDSNDKVRNPNVTVLEWLNGRPAYRGKVAAFASWELLPWILNEPRSSVFSNGDGPPVARPATDRQHAINDLSADLPPLWGSTRFDAATGAGAIEYLKTHRPRVLYVMLGETDEWAHGRRYDLYLDAAWRNDRFVRQLWEAAQAMPGYADQTALVLSTDHGRGEGAKDWTSHGRDVPAADRIWIAAMGPPVAALGVRDGVTSTQAQVAATIAALLGEDFNSAEPRAARPLNLQPPEKASHD